MSSQYSILVHQLENPSTAMNLLSSQEIPIEASGYGDDFFSVLLPKKSCAEGQFVEFVLQLKMPDKNWKIEGSAKVSLMKDFGEQFDQVIFELKETNHNRWKTFLDALAERQSKNNELFEKIRGW